MNLLDSYQLSKRFQASSGKVFLSGLQALARVPVEQLRADQRAGHNTSAFVSGYPGSPLGGFDIAIEKACAEATDVSIVHQPGLNEELAATSVMGSQLVTSQPDCLVDGVVGIWYGKAPGLDRGSDAIRIGQAAGASALGGALLFVGDDPAAKSSTIPSSRATVMADMHLPVLQPSNPTEVLDLGRHAIALSRASGLWVGVRVVSNVADGTGTVDLDPDRVAPIIPTLNGNPYENLPNSRLLAAEGVAAEREIFEVRYRIASIYAADNKLNKVTVNPSDAWIGIVAAGSTYRETRQALDSLGLKNDEAIKGAGIRLLQLQMTSPLDRQTIRDFASGVDEVFVVEDKDPNIESRIKEALYGIPNPPKVTGKFDSEDLPLLSGYGTLLSDDIRGPLRSRLARRLASRLVPEPIRREKHLIPVDVNRTPFFCSGCPHNTSTVVPQNSLVGSGIGCHTMVLLLDEERVGDIVGITAMGNEGTQWIGMNPFLEREHFIHNIGDGTYFHSGQLAIQAAVSAGVSMTFKLLYNGTLAMTGGQSAEGQREVADVVTQLLSVGVRQVIITTEDLNRYRDVDLPVGVHLWDRSRILEAQELLASVDGVTVLVHDQRCAAELRRERKRGTRAMPRVKVAINHRICEGCGDCGDKSNCLSVQPTVTPFGQKTRIDQTSCNIDMSCLDGDCPSFMLVTEHEPGVLARVWDRLRRGRREIKDDFQSRETALDRLFIDEILPDPVCVVPTQEFSAHIAGIGGTGVVTISQVLGTAAMFDGYEVRGLDQTGLSQKAGPVISDLRLSKGKATDSNRVGCGQADLLLAFDQLVAASAPGLDAASPDRTTVVGSTSVTPTGATGSSARSEMPSADDLAKNIEASSRSGHQHWADAVSLTRGFFGHSIYANVFVVGMALQAGCLPLRAESIERALVLNKVDSDDNVNAFRLGRRFILDPEALSVRAGLSINSTQSTTDDDLTSELVVYINDISASDADLADLLRHRCADLLGFQDEACAFSYLETVAEAASAERAVDRGSTLLTKAVATNLHKLLAYKDEYEVARLMIDDDGRHAARVLAGGDSKTVWKLHPPVLKALGIQRKISIGEWAEPGVRLLAKAKWLRGTRFDPFGRSEVRRVERELPDEYQLALEKVFAQLTTTNLDKAVAVAEMPDIVRGYEDIKLERVKSYRRELSRAMSQFD